MQETPTSNEKGSLLFSTAVLRTTKKYHATPMTMMGDPTASSSCNVS